MGAQPSLLGARFELRERIGEGSHNVVYAAVDRETGRHVAVKLPVESSDRRAPGRSMIQRRFDREAAALSVIASAHVVELISAGTTDDGKPYLVLERLYGRDLQEIVEDTGPLKPALVARLIRGAASALELAHGVGIVHRDLKPANLFIHAPDDQRPIVKVLDFGMVFDVEASVHRTREAFGGTPLYMAPEQVRSQLSRIAPATDVWALGLVAIRLLTGEHFWTGGTADDVMREIQAGPVEKPSERWPWLPPAFDAWFARSTQRVPERRFRRVATQAAELGEALRGVQAPNRSAAIATIGAATTLETRTPAPALLTAATRDSSAVARRRERNAITDQLAPGHLVTLTGMTGLGKSRLARLVCEGAGDDYLDGAWLVPVPAGAGAAELPPAILDALGVAPDSARTAFEQLTSLLVNRALLIVLDGIDDAAACAEVLGRLVAALPTIAWLATSRQPIGLPGEHCVAIEPLALPPADTRDVAAAADYAAIDWFVTSAQRQLPSYALATDDVTDVVGICRLLAGSPLGIELAAARVGISPAAEIHQQLQRRGPASDVATAARMALAWSYEQLGDDEQTVLRHLAVFPTGLTFPLLRAHLHGVIDDPAGAVGRLVRSNLLAWSEGADRRLIMIDPVRALCREHSAQLGETERLWAAALAHAQQTASREDGASEAAWLARIDAEHANVLAVLHHLLEHDADAAMDLAARLSWYWYLRGHYDQGARCLEAALARSGASAQPVHTRALLGAGRLALLRCQYERAAMFLERARDLANAEGDERGEAEAVQVLGSVARERGAYGDATSLHWRGRQLWKKLGDEREEARARNYLAFVSWLGSSSGDPVDATDDWALERSEQQMRRLGDPEGIVWALLNRGAIHHYAGDAASARETLAQAFAEAVALHFSEGIAWALNLIGLGSLARGELVQARAQLAAALRVHRRLGDLWRCASVLEALAAAMMAADHPARAAVYLGVAATIRERIGAPVPRCERPLVEDVQHRGKQALGDAFAVGLERGRRTSLDDAVDLATELT